MSLLAADGRAVGRRAENGHRRLTPEDHAVIRERYAAGLTIRDVAAVYRMSPSRIYQLVRDIARPRSKGEAPR